MMVYKVIMKVGYCEAFFEFEDIESAGDFARTILTKMVDSDDTKRKASVRIDVINTTAKLAAEEED